MERAAIARTESESASSLSDPSHQSLELWVRRRAGASDHERRVAQIAGALFDITQDLHDLSHRARWTLIGAALVHDVGKSVDSDDHARIGANILLTDPKLELSPTSRRWLAYLTLYHRGQVPAPRRDNILRPSDDAEGLLKVLGLLRAADTLDSRSIEAPRLLMMRRANRLQISCFLREVDERACRAFCRPKKYRLLEQTLGCEVTIEVQFGDTKMLSA
jgi:exopolyphosphatase/guanosine-5'-triphosphate,3'-diphosphate pyrophosphatase